MTKEEIQKVLDTSENPIEELGEIGFFEVNDWGSCQYTGALNMFKTLNILKEVFGREEATKKLGITVSLGEVRSEEEAVKLFQKEEIEDLKNWNSLEEAKELERITFSSLDDFFDYANNAAWDLWSAVQCIVGYVFPELKIESIFIQNENYKTGFYCWLLYEYCEIDEASFADFAT